MRINFEMPKTGSSLRTIISRLFYDDRRVRKAHFRAAKEFLRQLSDTERDCEMNLVVARLKRSRRNILKTAVTEKVLRERGKGWICMMALTLWIISIFAAPEIFARASLIREWDYLAASVAAYFVIFPAIIGLIRLQIWLWGKRMPSLTISSMIGAAILPVFPSMLLWRANFDSWHSHSCWVLALATFHIGICLTAMTLLALALRLITISRTRTLMFEAPETYLLFFLWKAYHRVIRWQRGIEENKGKNMHSVGLVNDVVRNLNRAAECVEVFSEASRGGGEEWRMIECRRRALAIREWQKSVILPKADTPQWLFSKLRSALKAVAVGSLDQLETFDFPPTPRSGWLHRCWCIGRAVTVALVPAAGFWGLKHFADSWIKPIEAPLGIFVIVWMVYHTLCALDPNLAEHLRTLSDLSKILPGTKEKSAE